VLAGQRVLPAGFRNQTATVIASEAEMQYDTSRRSGSHQTLGTAVWVVAGIILAMAFGDVLILLAVAVAIVGAAWWIYREVARHQSKGDAKMATVTHLGSARAGQRDRRENSAKAPWDGHSAA
jgi:hypothetical protein